MDGNVGRWISFWARVAPDRPALVFDGAALGYAELNRAVNRMANALAERGVGPGDRVAVLTGNRPELLVTVFACAKLGAIFVPLNVRLVARELEYIVRDADPVVLLSEPAFHPLLAEVAIDARRFDVDGFADGASDEEPPTVSGAEAFAICYTSGTTGLPKGAVLTHANIIHGSLQEIVGFGLSASDRHLVVVPLCFTGGLITASLPVFHAGATLHLERAFDPAAVVERIVSERITHMMGVPVMFAAMTRLPDFADVDFSSVKLFLVGAAPVPAALVDAYQSRGVGSFTNAFGLTEGTGFNLFLPATEVKDRPGAYLPAIYSDVRVSDEGELLIAGPCVMAGYWRNEAATAETIRDGWLHTGDVVRVDDDGYLHPVDRIKDMIITGGLNVYPAEVESVVFDHPRIADSTVIGLPERTWGEAVTIVAVRKDEALTADDVIAFCADELADYKRPKGVVFVDELPRNAGGKVVKRELRERFADHYARG